MILILFPLPVLILSNLASIIGAALVGTTIARAMREKDRAVLIVGTLYLALVFTNVAVSTWWLLHFLFRML